MDRVIIEGEEHVKGRTSGVAMMDAQTRIGGRYVLGTLIGQGKGSAVYLGKDDVLHRTVALKIVEPEYTDAYRNALGATTRIGHPAYVAVFDAIVHNDHLVIVQERVTAPTFSLLVKDRLSIVDIARMGRSLALAIAHAHRHGIVHGDLTPSSLFRGQWNPATLRINNILLPSDADYFLQAGKLLVDRGPWQITTPTIDDDMRAIGVILWLLLAGLDVIPDMLTGTEADWECIDRDIPEDIRDIVERLVDKEHPRHIDSAEALINIFTNTIHSLEATPSTENIAPPWERRLHVVEKMTTDPQMNSLQERSQPLAAFSGPVQIEPSQGSNDQVTIESSSPDAASLASMQAIYEQQESPDYMLWIALGIGLFLFWLIVGYVAKGFFGN